MSGFQGKPPVPTAILKMRGSWRAKRRRKEPQPEKRRPRRPTWLTDKAKAVWNHVVPLLESMSVLTVIDGESLARYCTLTCRWRECEDFLAKNGHTYAVKDADGTVTGMASFPQARIAQGLSESLLRLEQHFGMTPSSRARIAISAEKDSYGDKSRFFKSA